MECPSLSSKNNVWIFYLSDMELNKLEDEINNCKEALTHSNKSI